MNNDRVLDQIEPIEVFRYFEDLTRIPRESGNEKQITEYLLNFAKENGLEYQCDKYQNVLMKKKAAPGYDNHPGIILQGHLDMVCEKNENTEHDFGKDQIPILIEGDRITAKGTTLGADNGVGIAIALAILADKNAKHPALEVLCTSDEEVGMTGADNFNISNLSGKILINLDANDEGVLIVGCAGGPGVQTELPLVREEVENNMTFLNLSISGLVGGHSGEDIHRGRANSIKLMGRLLMEIERTTDMRLHSLEGGIKYNAIPREATAFILVPDNDVTRIRSLIENMHDVFNKEYRTSESRITLTISALDQRKTEIESVYVPFDQKSTRKVLDFLCLSQSGIIRMDMELKDTVESSSSLGVVKTESNKVVFQILTRSSVESIYLDLYYNIQRLTEVLGGTTALISNCPQWEYNPTSEVKHIFESVYIRMFGKDPKRSILHAGLECGVFAKKSKVPFDMIAVGPDIRNLHTPGEYVSISSVQRFWDYFMEVLKDL